MPNFCIEWNNLSYQICERSIKFKTPFGVQIKTKQKIILQPQSGFLSAGTLTALMGPSGAGKTTLLNCLSGTNSDWKGNIDLYTNGNQDQRQDQDNDKKQTKIKLNLAFVPQKDYLFDHLTVRETLNFALKSKKLSALSKDANQASDSIDIISNIASDLNLTACLDVKVSKLSGGQCKRLSVGVELVSPPDVLILDEPTSGLDSMNALMTIKVIRNLLEKDATYKPAIICSIHQPSFECVSLFDQIYLLSERGEKIYFDSPINIHGFLKLRNITVDMHHNPADYLLKLCNKNADIGNDAKDTISDINMQSINMKYRNTTERTISSDELIPLNDKNYDYKISVKDATENAQEALNASSLLTFILLLYQRNFHLMKADPAPLISRLVFCFVGVINLIVYKHKLGSHDGCWNTILDDEISNKSVLDIISAFKDKSSSSNYIKRMENVHDNINVIVVSDILLIYFHVLITGAIIPIESRIIQKEIYNNWYTINSYVISRLTFFIPIMILQVILYTLIFSLTSYQLIEIERHITLTISQLFLAWTSEVIGIAFGALFSGNLVSGITWTIMYTFPIVTMGGFFVRVNAVNPIVEGIMWGSQLRHAFEASIISMYGLGRCSSNDGTALTMDELMSSSRMMERAILDYDITHRDAKFIAPILGIPDDYCVGEVINGTRDYLGLNYADVDYDDINSTDIEIDSTDTSKYSYPMSSFGLTDYDLYRCFYSLSVILIIYMMFAVFTIKRLIKR